MRTIDEAFRETGASKRHIGEVGLPRFCGHPRWLGVESEQEGA
jgi:hypothetical protein